MTKQDILRWWIIFEDSPWRMFIHLEAPTFHDGKTVDGILRAYIKDGELYPVTGIKEMDIAPIKSAKKYHCDVN